MPTIRGKTGCGVLRAAAGPIDFEALQVSDGAVARWKLDSESGGVFDDDVGGYDFTIGDVADWTTSASGLPNGGGYTSGDGSIAVTSNADGDVFDFSDGTAWAVEYLFYRTGTPFDREWICTLSNAGTETRAWSIVIDTDGQPNLDISNTTNTAYLTIGVGTVETNRWHHIVQAKETGNTVRSWLNGRPAGSSSSTSGTIRTPTASYSLYLGSQGTGNNSLSSTFRVSRLAIYNALPTNAEVKQRYLAMFGA